MTILELPIGRSSRICRRSDSHFWSDMAHFHWAIQYVTAPFAKLAKGQCGKSILDQMHSEEHMKIMPLHFRFFICLDLFIDCHHCHCGSGTLESSASPELKSFLRDICTEASVSDHKKGRYPSFGKRVKSIQVHSLSL